MEGKITKMYESKFFIDSFIKVHDANIQGSDKILKKKRVLYRRAFWGLYISLFFALNLCLGIWPVMAIASSDTALVKVISPGFENMISTECRDYFDKLMSDYKISSQDKKSLLQVLSTAKKNDVPIRPLINKIEEGLGKKIPVNLIVTALNKRVYDYKFIKHILDNTKKIKKDKSQEQEINALVDVLSFGLSHQELKEFIKAVPPAPLSMISVALENMALLKQIDFNKKDIDRILFAGLRLKRFTPKWRYLARVIAVAKKRGLKDEEISQKVVEVFEENGSLKNLMEVLGFTSRNLTKGPQMGK